VSSFSLMCSHPQRWRREGEEGGRGEGGGPLRSLRHFVLLPRRRRTPWPKRPFLRCGRRMRAPTLQQQQQQPPKWHASAMPSVPRTPGSLLLRAHVERPRLRESKVLCLRAPRCVGLCGGGKGRRGEAFSWPPPSRKQPSPELMWGCFRAGRGRGLTACCAGLRR